MPATVILAIDQGTTNTKALLVGRSGRVEHRVSVPVELITLADGRVEQDPEALWQSVVSASEQAARHAKSTGAPIEAIAITNQRETSVAWSASTGAALANAVSWQCPRSAVICERLTGHADPIRQITGLPLAPLLSAGKWAWLLDSVDAVKTACSKSDLRLGTVDSWLLSKMTGGKIHSTDLTNASRTGLLDLSTLQWSGELCTLFGVPIGALPRLSPSSAHFDTCQTIEALRGVPILSAIGDSHAAMFGHGDFKSGAIKATYGTGSSLMALTNCLAADTPKLARTIAWAIGNKVQYALEGNIAMTGSAVQWLGDFLSLREPAEDIAQLASSVADSGGVHFVPAMVGLGAPYWDANARGAISGLARHHKAAHLARACVESVAFQVADVFFAMEQAADARFRALNTDGGATRNTALMQFQADILGRPVHRSHNEELSAIGAAWLAGLQLGWWRSLDELAALPKSNDEFVPSMSHNRASDLYSGWLAAVAMTLTPEAKP